MQDVTSVLVTASRPRRVVPHWSQERTQPPLLDPHPRPPFGGLSRSLLAGRELWTR